MIDRTLITRKIKLLEKDLVALKPLSKYSLDELAREQYLYLAAERLLEKLINRLIDINTHIIIASGDEPPQGYRESFTKMAELDYLPRKFVDQIIPSVGLRNRLVHEYDDLDNSKIYESIFTSFEQIPKYIEYILGT